MTLEGTNTYVVGAGDAAWVIDSGPDDPEHLNAVRAAAEERGGIAGVLLTHSHADHSAGVVSLGAPLLWGEVSDADETTGPRSYLPETGRAAGNVGPFTIIPTPGHAPDHVCFVRDRVCFCGDLVLGEGSSIVPSAAFGGSLSEYMDSLRRIDGLSAELLCPGHGPLITDPRERIAEYVAHRLERERRLVGALERGERSRAALLAEAWDDVPEALRPAAALAMQAHLEKLDAEGRLPHDLGD